MDDCCDTIPSRNPHPETEPLHSHQVKSLYQMLVPTGHLVGGMNSLGATFDASCFGEQTEDKLLMSPPSRPTNISTVRRRNRRSRLMIWLGALSFVALSLLMQLHVSYILRDDLEESVYSLSVRKARRTTGVSGLRVLYFGSSVGKQDDPHSYPFLLQQDIGQDGIVVNISRLGSSAVSAACTQTIVGDDNVYDIIMVEFAELDDNVHVLARRLRERFPAAQLVLIDLWNPTQLRYRKSSAELIDLDRWRGEFYAYTVDSMEFLVALTKSNPQSWVLLNRNHEKERGVNLETIVSQLKARIYSLPRPDLDKVGVTPEVLRDYLLFFQDQDRSLLSARGNEYIASQLQQVLDPAGIVSRTDRNLLGSWGIGDHCNIWYASGNYGTVLGGRHVDFTPDGSDGRHKHSIELRFGDVADNSNPVTVLNPFTNDRMLYLSYMTVEEDGVYPPTRVRIRGRPTVVIYPFHEENTAKRSPGGDLVQLVRTSAVGMIPPGRSQIELDPIRLSLEPFRLVGASLLEDDNYHKNKNRRTPFEFSLQSDPIQDNNNYLFWNAW